MITKQEASKLRNLIRDARQAAIDEAWVGAASPEDQEAIKTRRKKTNDKLISYIRTITDPRDRKDMEATVK